MGTLDNNVDLYDTWAQNPSKQTLTPLVKSLEPTIDKALNAYGYAGDANLKGRARILAIKALPRFDKEKANLDTFVFGELRRLQRIGPQQEFAVRVPERILLERGALERAKTDLQESLGREPTLDELKDRTGLSSKRIAAIRRAPDQVVGQRTDTEGQVIVDAAGELDDQELWRETVVMGLDPVDSKIYSWTVGDAGERLTKTQIAKRLGISPAAVTKRSKRIADKLAEGLEHTL